MPKSFLYGSVLILTGLANCYASIHAQSSASSRPLRDKLVGTWRFVKNYNTDASGKVTYPFGYPPSGYIVWDTAGHVFVQVARQPVLKPFASGSDLTGTDAEVRVAFERYDAYCGTYDVDEQNSVVIHHVDDALRPSYSSTDQRRPFRFQGNDTVIIENILSNQRGQGYRELERVK